MNARQKVYDMLEDFNTAMFVTTSPAGLMDARPMQLVEVEAAGAIWLLTAVDTKKVEDLSANTQALLLCQADGKEYLSIRGHARVVEDLPRVRRLWSELYNVWFPDGPDDPSIRLIAVEPVEAEFWDDTGTNRLKYLWEAAKVMAGERTHPADDPDQHGRTKF
jgi:general stress protein 26